MGHLSLICGTGKISLGFTLVLLLHVKDTMRTPCYFLRTEKGQKVGFVKSKSLKTGLETSSGGSALSTFPTRLVWGFTPPPTGAVTTARSHGHEARTKRQVSTGAPGPVVVPGNWFGTERNRNHPMAPVIPENRKHFFSRFPFHPAQGHRNRSNICIVSPVLGYKSSTKDSKIAGCFSNLQPTWCQC